MTIVICCVLDGIQDDDGRSGSRAYVCYMSTELFSMIQMYRIFYEFVLKPVATNELLIASAIKEGVLNNTLISAFYVQISIIRDVCRK